METLQFESTSGNLIRSENFLEENQPNNLINEHLKKYTNRSTESNKKSDEPKSSELISILEQSAATWNLDTASDISYGLANLQFEYGLIENQSDYEFLRFRSHLIYTTACAHATFFVGIANRIKRDLEDLKKDYDVVQKKSLLLNDMKKEPGLQIGIIGGGKLGRQLAESFLEFSKVYPNELHISTRQPDTLAHLQNKGVKCYFDNAHIAQIVDILFLCVLPSQLQSVIDDIKKTLTDKCILYNFVRTESSLHLKNLLGVSNAKTNIIKPNYLINLKGNETEWNYSLNIIECLSSEKIIEMTNLFTSNEDSLLKIDEYFLVALIFGLMNICNYLKLTQKEILKALRKFLFNSTKKPVKIEENFFFEKKSSQESFMTVDLVEASLKTTPLFFKIKTSKSFKHALSKCYAEFFEETAKLRNSFL